MFGTGTMCKSIFGLARNIWISSKYFGTCGRTMQKIFFSHFFFWKIFIFKCVESGDFDQMSSYEHGSELHSSNQLLTNDNGSNNLSSIHHGSKQFELKSPWLKTKWTQITKAQTIWAKITMAQNQLNPNHHGSNHNHLSSNQNGSDNLSSNHHGSKPIEPKSPWLKP